jgi:hypothetical protein
MPVDTSGNVAIRVFIRQSLFVVVGIAFVLASTLEMFVGGPGAMVAQASLSTISFLCFGTRPDLYRRYPSDPVPTTTTNVARTVPNHSSNNSKSSSSSLDSPKLFVVDLAEASSYPEERNQKEKYALP